MTEAEWSASDDVGAMLLALPPPTSARRLRLFAVACCRRAWDRIPPAGRRAVILAELYADGIGDTDTLADAAFICTSMAEGASEIIGAILHACSDAAGDGQFLPWFARDVADAIADAAVFRNDSLPVNRGPFEETLAPDRPRIVRQAEAAAMAGLLRDLYPAPSRPGPTIPAAWLTSPVLDLARAMYDRREFAAMPALADALEEAGCDSPDIPTHCRGAEPHVRGCWVVDLVLEKG